MSDRASLLAVERHARVVVDRFGEWWNDEDDGGDVEPLVQAMNRLRKSLERVSQQRRGEK